MTPLILGHGGRGMKRSSNGPAGEEEAGWKAEGSKWRDGWREPAILELPMGDGSFVTRTTMVEAVTLLMESDPCSGEDHTESNTMRPHARAKGGMEMVPTEERGTIRSRDSGSRR